MTDTHQEDRIDPLLTDEVIALSESQGIPILAPDYPISLKKRIHIAYDPLIPDDLYTNTIAEALALLAQRGHTTALVVSQPDDESPIIYGTIVFSG